MSDNRLFSSAALATLALAASACVGSGNSLNAYYGARALEADELEEVDDPDVYGADIVIATQVPALGVEAGAFFSEDETDTLGLLTDAELYVDEYFVGLRLTPWDFLLSPYVAAGATYIESSIETATAEFEDDVVAFYARLGVAMTFGFFRVGLDGRAIFGSDVELDTIESDVDGYQVTAFVGLGN